LYNRFKSVKYKRKEIAMNDVKCLVYKDTKTRYGTSRRWIRLVIASGTGEDPETDLKAFPNKKGITARDVPEFSWPEFMRENTQNPRLTREAAKAMRKASPRLITAEQGDIVATILQSVARRFGQRG
jgi:hypothetical protein